MVVSRVWARRGVARAKSCSSSVGNARQHTTSFIWSLCLSSNLAKSSLDGAPCAGRLLIFLEDIIFEGYIVRMRSDRDLLLKRKPAIGRPGLVWYGEEAVNRVFDLGRFALAG